MKEAARAAPLLVLQTEKGDGECEEEHDFLGSSIASLKACKRSIRQSF